MADQPSVMQMVNSRARIGGAGVKIAPGLTYVPNPAAPGELIRTPLMVRMLGERADLAAVRAREIAPVDTGAYRDSIEGQSGWRNSIAWGRLNAQDFKAGWIEFGTSRWPAHATLRLACESTGLAVRSGRRLRWRPSSTGTWY